MHCLLHFGIKGFNSFPYAFVHIWIHQYWFGIVLYCIVCPFSIYSFWLPLWYLQTVCTCHYIYFQWAFQVSKMFFSNDKICWFHIHVYQMTKWEWGLCIICTNLAKNQHAKNIRINLYLLLFNTKCSQFPTVNFNNWYFIIGNAFFFKQIYIRQKVNLQVEIRELSPL